MGCSPQETRKLAVHRWGKRLRNPFRRRDYERFVGQGCVMEREGRVVRTTSTLDADAHAEMRRHLGESVGDIQQEMS